MNFKLSFDRFSNQKLADRPGTEIGSMRCALTDRPTPTPITKYLGELGFSAIKNQKGREGQRGKAVLRSQTPRGLLGRAISWLNGSCAPQKQLMVLETVTLGDKRMVAMIQADGQRFLVGGGPSGISMLTPLDQLHKPVRELSSSTGLRELAG